VGLPPVEPWRLGAAFLQGQARHSLDVAPQAGIRNAVLPRLERTGDATSHQRTAAWAHRRDRLLDQYVAAGFIESSAIELAPRIISRQPIRVTQRLDPYSCHGFGKQRYGSLIASESPGRNRGAGGRQIFLFRSPPQLLRHAAQCRDASVSSSPSRLARSGAACLVNERRRSRSCSSLKSSSGRTFRFTSLGRRLATTLI
jgi:hypothetical protein